MLKMREFNWASIVVLVCPRRAIVKSSVIPRSPRVSSISPTKPGRNTIVSSPAVPDTLPSTELLVLAAMIASRSVTSPSTVMLSARLLTEIVASRVRSSSRSKESLRASGRNGKRERPERRAIQGQRAAHTVSHDLNIIGVRISRKASRLTRRINPGSPLQPTSNDPTPRRRRQTVSPITATARSIRTYRCDSSPVNRRISTLSLLCALEKLAESAAQRAYQAYAE